MVLECVPEEVADEVTRAVSVPTIGIGAGPHTSGYACVHDGLGLRVLDMDLVGYGGTWDVGGGRREVGGGRW
jgi:hypothetical protein